MASSNPDALLKDLSPLPAKLPLGASPAGRHSVVVSLPTLADVHAYEQGDPEARACIQLGYPRFVRHSLLCAAEGILSQDVNLRRDHSPGADPTFEVGVSACDVPLNPNVASVAAILGPQLDRIQRSTFVGDSGESASNQGV